MPSSYSRMSLEELRLCAQEGDTEAEYLLGQRLLGQRGRALEGMEHLKRAAAKRHLQACERLGSAYLYGEGDVPQDKKQATVYYEQALALGSTTARRQLIRLYLESEGRAERGLQLLTEAAEEGDKEAAARAARAYAGGIWLPRPSVRPAFSVGARIRRVLRRCACGGRGDLSRRMVEQNARHGTLGRARVPQKGHRQRSFAVCQRGSASGKAARAPARNAVLQCRGDRVLSGRGAFALRV